MRKVWYDKETGYIADEYPFFIPFDYDNMESIEIPDDEFEQKCVFIKHGTIPAVIDGKVVLLEDEDYKNTSEYSYVKSMIAERKAKEAQEENEKELNTAIQEYTLASIQQTSGISLMSANSNNSVDSLKQKVLELSTKNLELKKDYEEKQKKLEENKEKYEEDNKKEIKRDYRKIKFTKIIG